MKLRNGAIWQVVLLAGCASAPPIETRVPVAVPCIAAGDRPVRPALPTRAELDAMSDYQLPLGLDLYRVLAEAYIGELEAAVDGCSRLPTR